MKTTAHEKRCWGDNPPLTAQEEQETLETLRGRIATLTQEALRAAGVEPREGYHELLKQLMEHTKHRDSFMRLGEERGQELLRTLRDASLLEFHAKLPGRLGEESTPAGFFQRLEEHPEELRAMLLAIVDEEARPEESLAYTVRALCENLEHWRETPSLQGEVPGEPRASYLTLWHLSRGLLNALNSDPDIFYLSTFSLLRWRLERLGGQFVAEDGTSPLSLSSFDALVRSFLGILARWDELCWDIDPEDDEDLREAVDALLERDDLLAKAVLALEKEGLAEMPPAMQVALLEKTIYKRSRKMRKILLETYGGTVSTFSAFN